MGNLQTANGSYFTREEPLLKATPISFPPPSNFFTGQMVCRSWQQHTHFLNLSVLLRSFPSIPPRSLSQRRFNGISQIEKRRQKRDPRIRSGCGRRKRDVSVSHSPIRLAHQQEGGKGKSPFKNQVLDELISPDGGGVKVSRAANCFP